MNSSSLEGEGEKKVTENKTFQVPFALGEIKENIIINTNIFSNTYKERRINQAFYFHSQGNILKAAKYYQQLITQGFRDHRVFSNYGIILKDLGKLKEAEIVTRKAIAINPNFYQAYYNLGTILVDLENLEEAELSTHKAIELNPDYAKAHSSLGSILKNLGKLKEAEISCRKAIEINPNYSKAYYNLGVVLKDLGKLKEAEISYRKAIKINPNYSQAYSNLGSIMNSLGNIQEAELSYHKAIKINPYYSDAYWNLSGLANTIEEAEERINQCLKIDENYLEAKLTLSALKFHQGDKSLFDNLIKTDYKDHSIIRSLKWVSTLPKLPELFFNRWTLFENMINKSIKNRPFYEFGVWRGESFQYLINTYKKGYGFDTFEGLPEDWHQKKQGSYSAERIIPKIEGGTFIVGKFENTLPTFYSKPRPMASLQF
tara:strand:+ start:629 stop:1918 length:1290 start_codon:yes stop_codon:yes gene_type:complete